MVKGLALSDIYPDTATSAPDRISDIFPEPLRKTIFRASPPTIETPVMEIPSTWRDHGLVRTVSPSGGAPGTVESGVKAFDGVELSRIQSSLDEGAGRAHGSHGVGRGQADSDRQHIKAFKAIANLRR
jgi:hypothetical protein